VPRLLLISIDGLAHFYWSDPLARMPVLRGLAERGAVADGMATVFISTTWPSHVSLVSGVVLAVAAAAGVRVRIARLHSEADGAIAGEALEGAARQRRDAPPRGDERVREHAGDGGEDGGDGVDVLDGQEAGGGGEGVLGEEGEVAGVGEVISGQWAVGSGRGGMSRQWSVGSGQ